MDILNRVIEGYSSLGYGLLAAVVVVAILYLVIAGLQGGRKRFTPISYAAGIITGAFLTFQFMYLIGAINLKSDCKDAVSIMEYLPVVSDLMEVTGDLLIKKVHAHLNNYILRRVLWSIGFLSLGIFAVVLTMERPKKSHQSSHHSRTKFYDE